MQNGDGIWQKFHMIDRNEFVSCDFRSSKFHIFLGKLARENSPHFTMPSLVSPQINDIWEMSTEIP